MQLFHGSDVAVEHPRLLPRQRALDFGAGFYLTSSREQAERWAQSVARRRRSQSPTVSVYEFDEGRARGLVVLEFSKADGAWLDFVVQNRREEPTPQDFDIVIGPVANDRTLPVIDNYMAGAYPKAIAIQLLLPQKLTDQYAFRSESALECLRFLEARSL